MKLLPNITGLRGIAALLVVLYHYSEVQTGFDRATLPFLAHGYMMVDLFFVLSGIVMVHVYGDELTGGTWRCYIRFLWARVSRLWPVVAASIALGCVPALGLFAVRFMRGHFEPDILHYLFFNDSVSGLFFMGGTRLNGPLWSVITEFWVYPLLPLLLLMRRLPVKARIATAGLLLLWPFWAFLFDLSTAEHVGYGAYLRCLAGFATGVAIHEAMNLRPDARRFLSSTAALVSMAAVAVIAMSLTWPPFVALCAISSFVGCVPWAAASSPVSRLLESRPLVWLGRISFSLYAVHMPVQYIMLGPQGHFLMAPAERSVLLAVVMAVSLGLAQTFHRRIEIPGTAFLRRLPLTPAARQASAV